LARLNVQSVSVNDAGGFFANAMYLSMPSAAE
jgi:hypothetical protein